MEHPFLYALGLEGLLHDAAAFLEPFVSVRLLRLVYLTTLIVYGFLFCFHASQMLAGRAKPRRSMAPYWQIVTIAVLTATLHIRMTIAG